MSSISKKTPTKSLEWQLLILILVITIINYFDRGALAYAISPIQKSFGINNEQFGSMSAAFGIGYILMSFFAGFIVDRYGTIKVWPVTVAIWSLATFLMAHSTGFWSFFFLRILLGLAEAVHFPALLKTITQWLEPNWRSRCLSIGLLGVPLASVIGAPFLSYLIHMFSWQFMFRFLGFIGIIWIVIWWLFFRNVSKRFHPFSDAKIAEEQLLHDDVDIEVLSMGKVLKKLFSSKIFIGNCINFFILGYIIFFALSWLPGYLQQTFKVKILEAGGLIAIPWACSAAFLLLGGWLSDFIWKKTHSIRNARVYLIGIGLFLSGCMFFLTAISHSLQLDILLLSLGMGFAFFVNSPIYSINADLFESKAGTAQGIMTVFFALSGIISPWVTGLLAQITGSFTSAFYLIFVLSIISLLVSFFFQFDKAKSH